jgi:hypothetical protein
MRANFYDRCTDTYYHVTGYSMRTKGIRIKYFDGNGNELVGEDGEALIPLPGHSDIKAEKIISTGLGHGLNAGALARDAQGIRQIAKRFDRSDEAKHISQRNAEKQLKNK